MLKREKEFFQYMLDNEEEVIKALEKHYRDALSDINMSIRIMQGDELTQSKVYQLQYQQALKKQVEGILERLHAKEYTTIQQYLSDSYTNGFVGSMYSMHGQGIPMIATVDQNAAVKAVITDSKIREGLYDHLAVGVDGMKKAIRDELTRGIASNMRYEDIARNIAFATKASKDNAKNIVRTEGHRIQQASADDARHFAASRGADMLKQWDATLDGDTRKTHRELDGTLVELDELFVLSEKKKARYPGDFGYPEEDCQCRCVCLDRPRWALDESELETLKERAAFFKLDKTDSFEDFKEKYLEAAKPLDTTGKKAYNSSEEMFQKTLKERKHFKPLSKERFDQLTIAARKMGASIIRGTPEVEAHLAKSKATASTLGNVLMFRQDATMCEVLEETRHYWQNLHGMNDDKPSNLRTILNEIDAKENVILNAAKYQLPRVELELMQDHLAYYRKQLEEYQKGVK